MYFAKNINMQFVVNFLSLITVFLIFSSCKKDDSPSKDVIIEKEDSLSNGQNKVSLRFDTLDHSFENPWGIAFLAKGELLITERSGTLWYFNEASKLKTEVKGIPEVYANGQGGLLDVVLHPNFNQNKYVYFSYAKPADGGANTAVARAQWQNNQLLNWKDIYTSKPNTNSGIHFGSRLVFDNNNYLFVSIGERGNSKNAQDLSNPNGKILRLNDDGTIPSDNPFVGNSDALDEIWCYGIRNPQGLVLNKQTNQIWEHEHGPKGGDEINIIQKGANYGWPLVTFGIDYDGTIISNDTSAEGITDPIHYWVPSIAPCGMAFMNHKQYGQFQSTLWVGALAKRKVQMCKVTNNDVIQTTDYLDGLARFRDVKESPDGYIYIVSEAPGLLLKIIPVSE